MTNFEIIIPFLAAALVIFTGVVGVLCARVERRLAARKRISLANYKEKNHLFYILNDIPTAAIAGGVAVLSLGLLIACLVDPVVRIYAIALGVLLPINGAVAYLSMTRKKCGRDIRVFDTYYVQVENVLARKDRTLSDIKVCQRRVSELRSRLTQTIKEFNQNLATGVSGDFLPGLFAPIDKMIDSYIQEIYRFSAEVEKNFDDALQEFLLHETVPEFRMVPLRTFDESEVDDLLASIKSSYGDKIAGLVVEQINRGAVKSARALGNIMTLLHKLQVEMDKETLARFLASAARFEDRGELAALLYKNRQISVAMVREIFIPQNWEWTFVPGMAESFNRRELAAILSDVLAADRPTMCYRLLTRFDVASLDLLDTAIQGELTRVGGVANSAVRMASAYRLILKHTYAVGNSGNLFENIAYMLYDRRSEFDFTPEEQERIAELVRAERFYGARQEWVDYYGRARKSGARLVESATRILLQYMMAAPADFLDPARLAELFGEYRETLSFGDIATMRALLAAWLLLNSQDKTVTDAVLAELKAIPAVPADETETDPAHAILHYLTQKDRVRLRSVVYRTEGSRRMLDRILRL
ncbi:MAG: hypothetical protein IJX39_09630 [Clostridia bacterium]|nr:hypothetical protein [Clostridia bacterium]